VEGSVLAHFAAHLLMVALISIDDGALDESNVERLSDDGLDGLNVRENAIGGKDRSKGIVEQIQSHSLYNAQSMPANNTF
jgi:hypothetical protein